jgi:dipeptidyl aminopeptidase/acylaminoacyl peptidase
MIRSACQRIWLYRKTSAGVLVLLGLALVNIVAFNHAYAMTHFAVAGTKTSNPEALSFAEKLRVLFTGVTLPRPVNPATPESVALPYVVRTFQSTDGIELEAWDIGHVDAAATVVMFHGYATSKASLLREAKAFHDMGYAVLPVDFRGSGGSSGNETTVGVYEAEDVRAAVDYVRSQKSEQPIVLYGQSMGSAATLRALSLYNLSPAAVIIECPFDCLLSTVQSRFYALGLPSFPSAQLLVFWGGVQHNFNGFTHNPVEYGKNVRCPVLLLHGADDPRVTRQQAEAVFANLAGPKHLMMFEGVGHQPYLAARPQQWQNCVSEFLAENCPASAR